MFFERAAAKNNFWFFMNIWYTQFLVKRFINANIKENCLNHAAFLNFFGNNSVTIYTEIEFKFELSTLKIKQLL